MQRSVLVPFPSDDRAEPYLEALREVGLNPVPFLTSGVAPSLDDVDGLLLMGGTDVAPQRYGEQPAPETEPSDKQRDEVEWELLGSAIARDLPVLAICRGLQLLNVHQGGTLCQHILSGRHRVVTTDKGVPAHSVDIAPDSQLSCIFEGPQVQVNSRHHQAIARVAGTLRIAARDSSDGLIEALEYPNKRFIIGVQWHPENQVHSSPDQRRLFQAFASAC